MSYFCFSTMACYFCFLLISVKTLSALANNKININIGYLSGFPTYNFANNISIVTALQDAEASGLTSGVNIKYIYENFDCLYYIM